MTEYLLTISNNPEKGRWWVRGHELPSADICQPVDLEMDTWDFLKWIATIILDGERYVN